MSSGAAEQPTALNSAGLLSDASMLPKLTISSYATSFSIFSVAVTRPTNNSYATFVTIVCCYGT